MSPRVRRLRVVPPPPGPPPAAALTLSDVTIEWGPNAEHGITLSSEQLARILAYTVARWGASMLDDALEEMVAPENIGASAQQLADMLSELRTASLKAAAWPGLQHDGLGMVEDCVRDLVARCAASGANPASYRVIPKRRRS